MVNPDPLSTTDVPQVLIHTLFRHPELVPVVLDDAGLPPHEIAMWARQTGNAPEIEKLAGWLSVAQALDYYKPLLEVAATHLRAGDYIEALPVFRWAYQRWQRRAHSPKDAADGVKLLALWGECLYQLGDTTTAQRCWKRALDNVQGPAALERLMRTIERLEANVAYTAILNEATRRHLAGATRLWARWERLQANPSDAEAAAPQPPVPAPTSTSTPEAKAAAQMGIAVLADVANLDMVCREQFGYSSRLDYQHLLQRTAQWGTVRVKQAFVPDIPATLATRADLADAGFEIDLLKPKRSHGRMVANADTAMAAYAVRWAADPQVARLELWTGDGDFLRAREAVHALCPDVAVTFRSFEAGTAAGIRLLADAWQPIDAGYLRHDSGYLQRTGRPFSEPVSFRYQE